MTLSGRGAKAGSVSLIAGAGGVTGPSSMTETISNPETCDSASSRSFWMASSWESAPMVTTACVGSRKEITIWYRFMILMGLVPVGPYCFLVVGVYCATS